MPDSVFANRIPFCEWPWGRHPERPMSIRIEVSWTEKKKRKRRSGVRKLPIGPGMILQPLYEPLPSPQVFSMVRTHRLPLMYVRRQPLVDPGGLMLYKEQTLRLLSRTYITFLKRFLIGAELSSDTWLHLHNNSFNTV
jgi:hypothetical protein